MRLKPGDNLKNIILPEIGGSTFDLKTIEGKATLLSFYRFASCPFCNLRLNEIVKRYDEFGENFEVVAVFNSSLHNLTKHTEDHQAPFPILADEEKTYYRSYGIEYSWFGFLKGMITRLPSLVGAMFKGFLPAEFNHRLSIMPADFLIDAEGVIHTAYYGNDEGDHLPFDEVKKFSLSSLSRS